MKTIVVKLIIVGTILMSTSFARAGVAPILNSVDGNWGSPVGGTNITTPNNVLTAYGNGSQDQIRWGTLQNGNTIQSGLGFTGSAQPSQVIGIDTPFEIGQLQHFNWQVAQNTSATSVGLAVAVGFDGGSSAVFDFTLHIDETPNVPILVDDIIDFQMPGSQAIDINGQSYMLELLGFRDVSGNPINSLVSPEEAINNALLWGELTQSPTIPAPGAIILASLGAGIVDWLRRRRGL